MIVGEQPTAPDADHAVIWRRKGTVIRFEILKRCACVSPDREFHTVHCRTCQGYIRPPIGCACFRGDDAKWRSADDCDRCRRSKPERLPT